MRRDIPLARLKTLPVTGQGLSSEEIAGQRQRYGRNDIVETAANPWLELARDTLKDPMIWFLIGTGAVYAILGSYTEAVSLLVAILPLIGMDFFLHRRTQASTEGLSRQLSQTAVAIRGGTAMEIPAVDLVPGDLVRVATGEPFPADGLIVEGLDLQADESSLTGEAFPIAKHLLAWPPAANAQTDNGLWVDEAHWGFAGTRLLTGKLTLRVVFTGAETLYGEIVQAAATGQRERTPLQEAIGNLVTTLMVFAGVLCLILAGVRLHQGHDWVDALVSAATLAVAALPEEFPVVFTVFLGVGVYRLARQKALVRRGVSVENIGRVTCVCSDKTGTLTEGRLRLQHIVPAADHSEDELLRWAALASRLDTGDPMDTAIIGSFSQRSPVAAHMEVLATYPYTEQRRRESAVVQIDGKRIAVSKGSPEILLPLSSLTVHEQRTWTAEIESLAEQGHKVLACLYWDIGPDWQGGEPDRAGQFAGLLAFEDPVRAGAHDAVRECREAGIRVIMVTGDHPATAACIARELGLIEGAGGVILGDALARRVENGKTSRIDDFAVVARALPTQKLLLVRALKARGEIVAVTGDGVNDVPALQAADIGIAMGERGTRSAREAAAIVLLDDNFRTIVRAIAEGRQLFRNLQLSFQYILLLHIPLVITATVIPLMGYPILYMPIHIVWYETLIHPTALLVFQELPAHGPLQPASRRTAARFFSLGEWALIAIIGTLLTALLLWSHHRSLQPGLNIEHARAMAMVILCVASAATTAVLSGLRTPAAWVMTLLTMAVAGLFVQVPWFASHLFLQPLHSDDWLIAAIGGFVCIAVPIALYWFGRWATHSRAADGSISGT